MTRVRTPRPRAQQAAAILRRVLGTIQAGFAFRLWDGSEVSLGSGAPACTVVVHAPETFTRLMRDPTPLNFAEAYVGGAIDIEGDLFAAMKVADVVEELRLSPWQRLRILVALWAA